MIQELWVDGPLPGLNELIAAAKGERGRGTAYARLKKDWTERIWALARSRRMLTMGYVSISFLWVEKDRRRDPDNVSSAGRKLVLDGLVKAGVLPGDGWSTVAGWSDDFVVGARPGVRVKLSEVPRP